MECFEEKLASPRDFSEGNLAASQLQHEYDDIVQKVESDDKLRKIQEEAKFLMHSWPDQWFLKSKAVPKNLLDPETEEVLFVRCTLVVYAMVETQMIITA